MSPVRTCIGCRACVSKEQLIRVVLDAGKLQLDWNASLPGRGAWLHPRVECVQNAINRKQFRRALRKAVDDDYAVRQYLEELPVKVVDRTMDQS